MANSKRTTKLPPPGPSRVICTTPSICGCEPTKRCLIITGALGLLFFVAVFIGLGYLIWSTW